MCDVAWFDEFLGMNAVERKRRDLIVQYAESHGGLVEDYLRAVYPRYWQRVEFRDSFDRIGEDLNLTAAQEAKILADMGRAVVPSLRTCFPEGPTQPHLPETVAHLGRGAA